MSEQYTYIHVNSSDIYTLPQYRVKQNSVISTTQMWINLISNITEYYQMYDDENYFFNYIIKKFFFDKAKTYGNIDSNDSYVIQSDVIGATEYRMLPGIQPRQPNVTKNITNYGSSALPGNSIGLVSTLDYGHNRTRKSKFVFTLFSSYLPYFLFRGSSPSNSNLSPTYTPLKFTGNVGNYGPCITQKTTSFANNSNVLNTFANQCYDAIETTRVINNSTEQNDLLINFGYSVTGINSQNSGVYYKDTLTEDNIMYPKFGNFPSYQLLMLHVSTLSYPVCIGNPNGTYYVLNKYSSTKIIIPNPDMTQSNFGNSRYYYMFLDNDISGNSQIDGNIKIWVPSQDNINVSDINVSNNENILIIHSIESIPDAREIANSYNISRTMQLTDFMFSLLTLFNYISPMFIHYYNIVTVSLGLHYIITKVVWEMLDTTFVDLYDNIHTDSVIN